LDIAVVIVREFKPELGIGTESNVPEIVPFCIEQSSAPGFLGDPLTG
jgi:hypothetical protein